MHCGYNNGSSGSKNGNKGNMTRAFIWLVLSGGALILASKIESSSRKHGKQPIEQNVTETCKSRWDDCPDFWSHADWNKNTETCCSSQPGMTFHCQEITDHDKNIRHLIVACLPWTICEPGMIPVIRTNVTFSWITCEPCPINHFESSPRKSYLYRFPSCKHVHQTCRENHGKKVVRPGNSTHDSICRCLWEKGYAPYPKNSLCNNGFDGSTHCQCSERHCPRGTQLNQEFQCVPLPPTQPTRVSLPKSSSSRPTDTSALNSHHPQNTRSPARRTPFPPWSRQPEGEKEPEKDSLWYLVFIVLGLVVLFPIIKRVVQKSCGHSSSRVSGRRQDKSLSQRLVPTPE